MRSPWRFVPLGARYDDLRASERRRGRWWSDLLGARRPGRGPRGDPTPAEARLGAVDRERLGRLAPAPPRAAQRAAYDALRARTPQALIVRPDDGSWNVALDDVGPYGPTVIDPPDDPPLGRDLPDAVHERLDDPRALHLPRLERWWVRHHDGIRALRTVLARLGARRGPWTADVAPWAWAWIVRTLPEARGLPPVQTPAPLRSEDLRSWLGPPGPLRMRGSGTPPDDATFRALADRASGEPGVARAIWRACLHDGAEWTPPDAAPDAPLDGAADPRDGAVGDDAAVWVRSPSRLTLPSTRPLKHRDLLLLHAVALHRDARLATLALASGFEPDEAAALLRRMGAWGLVRDGEEGRVRLAPLGLPAVRSRLDVEAFAGVDE